MDAFKIPDPETVLATYSRAAVYVVRDAMFWNQPKQRADYLEPVRNLGAWSAGQFLDFVKDRGFPG